MLSNDSHNKVGFTYMATFLCFLVRKMISKLFKCHIIMINRIKHSCVKSIVKTSVTI